MTIAQTALDKLEADEDSRLRAWGGKAVLRLDLLMDYSEPWKRSSPEVTGVVSLRWTALDDTTPSDRLINVKAILAASLYARVLTIGYASTLFEPVHAALQAYMVTGTATSLAFKPLSTVAPDSSTNVIWPWKTAPWGEIEARKPDAVAHVGLFRQGTVSLVNPHSATLWKGPEDAYAPAGIYLQYRPAAAFGRVMMPAAALIAISDVVAAPGGLDLLAWLLVYINQYLQSPERMPPKPADAMAVAAALQVLPVGTRTAEEWREAARVVAECRRRDDENRERLEPPIEAPTAPTDWLENRLTSWLDSASKWFRRG